VTPSAFQEGLRGVIAFTPTPFSDDDRLAVEALQRHVAHLATLGGPVAVCGAVGEYAALDDAEYRAAIEASIEAAEGRVPVIVGIGAGTRVAMALAAHAARAGASGILVNPVPGGESSDDGLLRHVRAIADASGLGLIAFSTRGQVIGPELLVRLCEIDQVVGFKDEWGDLRLFAAAREHLGDRVAWIDGMAELQAAEYVTLGATAMTSGLVNVAPELAWDVWRSASSADQPRVRELVRRIRPFAALRARRPGYSIAVIKAAMAEVGIPYGEVRSPLSPMTPEDRAELRVVLDGLLPTRTA
jgi:5-dehydro-4-deoxyglucarate dehydratase